MAKNTRLSVLMALAALPLLGAALANHRVEGFNWSAFDFVFIGMLLYGCIFLFEYIARKSNHVSYRAATGLAILSGLMVIWGNGAVGFIGSEDNPANLMYLAVLAIAFLGAIIARFEPQGMSRVMFAAALGQALVPVIAIIIASISSSPIWDDFSPGVVTVMALNAIFVVLFVGSGLLFRQACEASGQQVTQ